MSIREALRAGFRPCVQVRACVQVSEPPKPVVQRTLADIGLTSFDSFLSEYRKAGSVQAQYRLLAVHKRAYLQCFFHLKLIPLAQAKPRTTTLLHCAVAHGSRKFVAFFLKYGASVEAVDETGRTALHKAILRGDMGIVTPLIEGAKNLNVPDDEGNIALHVAVRCYLTVAVKMLLPRSSVNTANGKKRTPLHYPCLNATDPKALEMAQLLRNAGASPLLLDHQEMSPLDFSLVKSRPGLISTITRGVDNAYCEVFERRFLAQLFNIPGETYFGAMKVSYGGQSPYLLHPRFIYWCQAFVESAAFKSCGLKVDPKVILEPLGQFGSFGEEVTAIEKGKCRVFYPYWQQHSSTLVFSANQLVMKCNSGDGCVANQQGVHLYRAKSYKNLKPLLQALSVDMGSAKLYDEALEKMLGLECVGWIIKEAKPKLDSCPWTARASGMRAVFYAHFLYKGHKEAARCSALLFDLWEGFIKNHAPSSYLERSSNPDRKLIQKIYA